MEESCTEASWKVGVTVASKLEGKEKWHKAGVCYEIQRLLGTEEWGAPLPGSRTASSGGFLLSRESQNFRSPRGQPNWDLCLPCTARLMSPHPLHLYNRVGTVTARNVARHYSIYPEQIPKRYLLCVKISQGVHSSRSALRQGDPGNNKKLLSQHLRELRAGSQDLGPPGELGVERSDWRGPKTLPLVCPAESGGATLRKHTYIESECRYDFSRSSSCRVCM